MRKISFIVITLILVCMTTSAQNKRVVRIARLEIDPTKLEEYKAIAKEEIETSVGVEPGVISLYAVAEKDNPSHITVFEIYASDEAYRSHIKSPHFLKYKNSTKDMVKSLVLTENTPILLSAKK